MTVVTMSKQEFSRLQVLLDVQSGQLRIEDAAQLIGLGRRQAIDHGAIERLRSGKMK